MPLVLDVMKIAAIDFEQLDRIAVTRGPGSFTGLRIGLAAARGMGLASGKPVVGIDRFSIYHELYKDVRQTLLVVIQSRRTELFCRFYPDTGELCEPSMMTVEQVADFLANHPNTKTVGDTEKGGLTSQNEVVMCALLAAKAEPTDPAFLPRPLYLRAPDVTFPSVEMRPATTEDAGILATLHATAFSNDAWSREQIMGSLKQDTTRGWIAFTKSEAVGFILMQTLLPESEILTFCVHPAQQRRGIGRQLLRQITRVARGDIFLEVAADNTAALALYKKLGFRETGRRAGYYKRAYSAVDAVLFTLFAPSA